MRNMNDGLIILLFLSSSLLHVHHVQAQGISKENCSDSANNYAPNTQFQTNLNLLLDSLRSNGTTRNGFFNDTVGTSPDTVYGLVQCRGDKSRQECGTCLSTSTKAILQRCPFRKSASLAYDECFLRYSDTQFSGKAETDFIVSANPQDVSDVDGDHFSQQLERLMNNLSTNAAYNHSRYDYGWINYTSTDNISGLVQCTQDLSPTNCLYCLRNSYSRIERCCNRVRGVQTLSSTCYARYELYPFVGMQLQSPPPPRQVDAPPPPPREDGNGKGKPTSVVTIVAPVIGVSLLLLSICAFIIIKRTWKNRSRRKSQDNEDGNRSEESLQFDLNTIKTATNDFSDANKLGEGGFGAVYKGELVDGLQIAVKRLSKNSGQGWHEFKNEVVLLHKLHHRNLVRLLGFCTSREENLLIYEYIPNKSLDKYIFAQTSKTSLNWENRYKIIEGIARGLHYLHEESRLKIIHRDLKAGNILLDIEMNAKIADFGMAKLFGVDQTQGNTIRIAGTLGYMAPEYMLLGLISVKSDVYSFGILVLEIITGQKICNFHLPGFSGDLTSYVWKQWSDGNALEMMDPTLQDSFFVSEVLRCIHIGLLCIQHNLKDRPTMSDILLMLSNNSFRLETPTSPAFIYQTMTTTNDPEKDIQFKDSMRSLLCSKDYISCDFPR